MAIIRLTFKNGKSYFVKENRKSMVMVDNIKDAFKYKSTLEFKVSFKLMRIMDEPDYSDKGKWRKDDVVKFELVDDNTLELKEFNVKDIEIVIKNDLYFDRTSFKRLMKCGISSSHWLYDNNDNWIAFPKENDYDKITKIRYYERGLTHTMESQNNWNDRYDENSWHSCYEHHHKLMLNPIIQQICLMNLDCCHEFKIYEDNLNKN